MRNKEFMPVCVPMAVCFRVLRFILAVEADELSRVWVGKRDGKLPDVD